jgi:hypothetical protein
VQSKSGLRGRTESIATTNERLAFQADNLNTGGSDVLPELVQLIDIAV